MEGQTSRNSHHCHHHDDSGEKSYSIIINRAIILLLRQAIPSFPAKFLLFSRHRPSNSSPSVKESLESPQTRPSLSSKEETHSHFFLRILVLKTTTFLPQLLVMMKLKHKTLIILLHPCSFCQQTRT